MPAHDRGNQSLEAYLSRVLLALAKKNGGEIRVHCADIDGLGDKETLIRDYDRMTNEVVLRCGTKYAEMLVIQPEAAAWAIPFPERAAERPELLPKPSRGRVPTDEELAEVEKNLRRPPRTQGPVE